MKLSDDEDSLDKFTDAIYRAVKQKNTKSKAQRRFVELAEAA